MLPYSFSPTESNTEVFVGGGLMPYWFVNVMIMRYLDSSQQNEPPPSSRSAPENISKARVRHM
jgi:hypothetical protein